MNGWPLHRHTTWPRSGRLQCMNKLPEPALGGGRTRDGFKLRGRITEVEVVPARAEHPEYCATIDDHIEERAFSDVHVLSA